MDQAHVERYKFASRFAEGKRVLDIACSNGYGSMILAEHATRVFGADSDQRAIHLATKGARHPKVEYHLADARQLPFPNGYFDLIVSLETIEHFVEQTQFLEELRRVGTPDATFIISTPDHDVMLKMGVYHSRTRDGFGHPGEMSFAQLDALLSRFFTKRSYFGQMFLQREPGLRDRFVNTVKRWDILHLRRLLLSESLRARGNTSAKLVNEQYQPLPLTGQAAQLVAVCQP